jgi:hypothetical protein
MLIKPGSLTQLPGTQQLNLSIFHTAGPLISSINSDNPDVFSLEMEGREHLLVRAYSKIQKGPVHFLNLGLDESRRPACLFVPHGVDDLLGIHFQERDDGLEANLLHSESHTQVQTLGHFVRVKDTDQAIRFIEGARVLHSAPHYGFDIPVLKDVIAELNAMNNQLVGIVNTLRESISDASREETRNAITEAILQVITITPKFERSISAWLTFKGVNSGAHCTSLITFSKLLAEIRDIIKPDIDYFWSKYQSLASISIGPMLLLGSDRVEIRLQQVLGVERFL